MNVMNTYTHIYEYTYVCVCVCVCVYVYKHVSNGADLTSSLEAVCWDVESQGFCISWVQMLALLIVVPRCVCASGLLRALPAK